MITKGCLDMKVLDSVKANIIEGRHTIFINDEEYILQFRQLEGGITVYRHTPTGTLIEFRLCGDEMIITEDVDINDCIEGYNFVYGEYIKKGQDC